MGTRDGVRARAWRDRRSAQVGACFAAAALLGALATLAPPARASAQDSTDVRSLTRRDLRLRLQFQGEFGGVAGIDQGPVGGAGAGVGVQIGDYFAVYGQHRLLFGDLVDGRRRGLWGVAYNSLMAEVTLFDLLQFGAGPSIDFGVAGVCDPAQERCPDYTGFYPGFDVRVALAFGPDYGSHRRGFLLAAHLHPTFYSRGDAVVTATLAAGFVLY